MNKLRANLDDFHFLFAKKLKITFLVSQIGCPIPFVRQGLVN